MHHTAVDRMGGLLLTVSSGRWLWGRSGGLQKNISILLLMTFLHHYYMYAMNYMYSATKCSEQQQNNACIHAYILNSNMPIYAV